MNSKGEKITIKAHGGSLDIQGLTVAKVDAKLRVTSLETWFDPMDMFNQMKPDPSTAEVYLDDHKLNSAEAKELLEENPGHDSGVEALVDEVKGPVSSTSVASSLTETIEGDPIANKENVHLMNPTTEGHEHSEKRTSSSTSSGSTAAENTASANAPPHPISNIANAGACPFMNGGGAGTNQYSLS